MDINELERLNKLKKQGVLTEEEFEKEKQKYLNGTKNDLNKVNPKASGAKEIVIWTAIVLGIYFFVNIIYPYSIVCKDGVPEEACKCVKSIQSKNVPFYDKVRFIIFGASEGELNAYSDPSETIRCLSLIGE